MRSITFFLFLLLLKSNFLFAQSSYDDQNAISLPSANNDFLKSQPDYNVSLYTGVPQLSIPLCNLASKELSIPVSLSYVGASGIKVQDNAGFAGLGWQLKAGGSISRVVRGRPDEIDSGYIGTHLFGQTLNAGLTSTVISQVGQGQFDGEPDLFTITTPFFSFKFELDQYGNPIFSNNTGLRISHNLYNNYNFQSTSWIVTDADGNQYFFGTTSSSRENMTSTIFNKSQTFTSTWYLDKIVTFNSKDVITLIYTAGPDYSVKHYMSSSIVWNSSPNCTPPANTSSSYNYLYTYNAPKYISKIVSSIGEIDMTYAFDRQDFANAGRITSIALYPYDPATLTKATASKTFQFTCSYFGAPSSNPDALRLRLDNISLLSSIGTDAPLTYKSFDYNTTVNLPVRNSVEFDYWGYYNTNSTGTSLVPTANKTPDPNRATANILTGIHDLSGEVIQLFYELNTYYDASSSSNKQAGGLRVNQISKTAPSETSLYTQYVYNDANGRSTGQIYNGNSLLFTRVTNFLITNGQTGCGVSGTSTFSESIYSSSDLNGNLVGYSSVKIVSQNGGYEIDQFRNFSDAPDVFNYATTSGQVYGTSDSRQLSSATSFSYKRGLPVSKSTYTAAGDIISKTEYTYSSLDALVGKATGVRAVPFTFLLGSSVSVWVYGSYVHNVENYALTQSIQTNYDQQNPSLTQQTVTNYTYAANHRLVQKTDMTDSKGQSKSKWTYYTEDMGAPDVTGNERYAIGVMQQGNKTNAIVHTIDIHNQSSTSTHNSYLAFRDGAMNNKVLLAAKKTSVNNGSNPQVQQFQYDLNSSNLIAMDKLGGPYLSTMYGYNNTYMTAKVTNALNSFSATIGNGTGSGEFIFPPNNANGQSTNIVVDYTGTVTFHLLGVVSTTAVSMYCSLSGTAGFSGTVCVSSNNSCGSYTPFLSFSNVPPGAYTLSVSPGAASSSATLTVDYTYPQYVPIVNTINEFYYEGFESMSSAATATPFAGKRYYSGAYTVPFTMPNARSYQIDYHYLSNGTWYAMTKPFSNNMVLNDGSAVDEVRVYPVDAKMTTYTYDPLNGVTSQCDARNRFTFYSYDGFGRLQTTRDNDGNILTNNDYKYQEPVGLGCPAPHINSVTKSGLTVIINYTAPSNASTCVFSILNQSTGLTAQYAQGCSSPVTLPIPATAPSYLVTVTSYSADCPGGVASNTMYVPTN